MAFWISMIAIFTFIMIILNKKRWSAHQWMPHLNYRDYVNLSLHGEPPLTTHHLLLHQCKHIGISIGIFHMHIIYPFAQSTDPYRHQVISFIHL